MRTISNAMATAMETNSTLLAKATLMLDGASTPEEIPPTRIMDASFEQHTSSESSFDLGGAIVGTASVTLWNGDGYFDAYDFTDATLACYIGKDLGSSVEWVPIGKYYVEQPDSYSGTIGLSLKDSLSLLVEKKFADSELTYPILPLAAMTALLNSCGVTYVIDGTPVNNTNSITRAPDDDMTCLDAVGYLAQLMGLWVRCDGRGIARADWYDTSAFDEGGTYQTLGSPYSETVMLDDVVITGVSVTASDQIVVDDDDNETNGEHGETALAGSEGYVLSIDSNPFVGYGRAASVAAELYQRVGGMAFRPFERSMPCNPAIETGDAVSFEDLRGNVHHSYATGARIVVNGAMDLRCSAKSAARNSSASASAMTAAIVKMRSMLDREQTGREVADNLIRLIAEEANTVATATNQHFWHRSTDPDSDGAGTGAFVTDEEQETFLDAIAQDVQPTTARPLHNLLMNAEGILLRAAKRIRAAFTPSGVAFYDGNGNESTNIVATFGAGGTQIGKTTEKHMVIDSTSIKLYEAGTAASNVVASFDGDSFKLGGFLRNYLYGDYHSLQMRSSGGIGVYFHISDLRDKQGVATITDSFVGDGSTRSFELSLPPKDSDCTVEVDGETVSSRDVVYVSGKEINFYSSSTPSNGSKIRVTYKTTSDMARAYTLGYRQPTTNLGGMSLATGFGTEASGLCSMSSGELTKARGGQSHAEGYGTEASGHCSHAEGQSTTASGGYSHAEGNASVASGQFSHAEGYGSEASGKYSHAQNDSTVAAGESQTAIGRSNVSDTSSALIIGNGINGNRSNALTVDWKGNVRIAGSVRDLSGNDKYLPLAGGEITGALTARGEMTATGADIRAKSPTINRDGKLPSETLYSPVLGFLDKDGELIGYMQVSEDTAGTITTNLYAYNEVNGEPIANRISTFVRRDGTRGYEVTGPAAFREAINAAGVSNQANQNVSFAAGSGNAQVQIIGFNVTNTGHALNGKRLALLIRSDGISLYNSTDSAYLWRTDVQESSPTITNATATTFKLKKQLDTVCLLVDGLKLSAALANGSSVSLGTNIIPSAYRPEVSVRLPILLNSSTQPTGLFLFVTSAGNVTLYNRSGASLPTSTSLSASGTWIV